MNLTLVLKPSDFKTRLSKVETMNYFELNDYIKEEEIAKTKEVGIWIGEFIDPYLFRKQNK